MDLVYPNETKLFRIAMVFAVLLWLLIIVGTFGVALLYIGLFAIFAIFVQSGFISHIKGNGIEITEQQYPDLHQALLECCDKVGLEEVPQMYLLRTDFFNALATRFLRRHYVVLFTDVVDALQEEPEAVRFYIGHELGHIHRNHIRWGWVLAPVTWLPVLGSAYRRAEEYTCDRYGNACCERESAAVAAMATIVAGDTRWRDIDVAAYLRQVDGTGGFFMSLNELTGDYPWLCKRMAWVLALRQGSEPQFPRRSRRAWVLSLFVPSVPGGFGGAIVLIAIIGIIAAVALPAYQEYVATAELAAQQAAEQLSQSARGAAVEAPASGYWEAATVENLGGIVRETGAMRAAIEEYYAAQSALPTDLTELGWTQSVVPAQNGGIPLAVYQGGVIGAGIDAEQNAYLVIEPAVSDEGTLNWFCYGQNLPAEILPEQCQE